MGNPHGRLYAKEEAWIAEEGNDLDAVVPVRRKTWPL